MACMIGVDRTEINSRPNATNSSTDRGVAGRSMMTAVDRSNGSRERGSRWASLGQRRQDAAKRSGIPSKPRFGGLLYRDYCEPVLVELEAETETDTEMVMKLSIVNPWKSIGVSSFEARLDNMEPKSWIGE